MQSMVEALHHLASLERGHVVAMTRPVNIDEELENALQAAMKDAASARAFTVQHDLTGPGPVRTDPALLTARQRFSDRRRWHWRTTASAIRRAAGQAAVVWQAGC